MTDINPSLPTVLVNDEVESIVREVLGASPEETAVLVVRHLEELRPDQKGSELEVFLQSMWNHLEGVQAIIRDNNPARAKELQELAVDGFQRIGAGTFETVARSLSIFVAALIDLRVFNVQSALDNMNKAELGLVKAGQYGHKFQPLIDHMKPEQLALSAVPALMQGDHDTAKVLINQASESYAALAEKYYEKDSPGYSMAAGFGYYYLALHAYIRASVDLSILDLEKLASPALADNAEKAQQLLSKADLDIAQVRLAHELSKCLVEALNATKGVAARMKLCFEATIKPDLQGYRDLQGMISRAIDYASNIGPQGLPLVTALRRDEERLKNLEKLARPRKNDFGIFSGLISAGLFAILLLAYGWSRSAFGNGLEARELMVLVGLALIGGFGFGALKFWNYFTGFLSPRRDDQGGAA